MRHQAVADQARSPALPSSGWEYFSFIDDWSTEFNFDGLAVWDTQAAYHHYPGAPATAETATVQWPTGLWKAGLRCHRSCNICGGCKLCERCLVLPSCSTSVGC